MLFHARYGSWAAVLLRQSLANGGTGMQSDHEGLLPLLIDCLYGYHVTEPNAAIGYVE